MFLSISIILQSVVPVAAQEEDTTPPVIHKAWPDEIWKDPSLFDSWSLDYVPWHKDPDGRGYWQWIYSIRIPFKIFANVTDDQSIVRSIRAELYDPTHKKIWHGDLFPDATPHHYRGGGDVSFGWRDDRKLYDLQSTPEQTPPTPTGTPHFEPPFGVWPIGIRAYDARGNSTGLITDTAWSMVVHTSPTPPTPTPTATPVWSGTQVHYGLYIPGSGSMKVTLINNGGKTGRYCITVWPLDKSLPECALSESAPLKPGRTRWLMQDEYEDLMDHFREHWPVVFFGFPPTYFRVVVVHNLPEQDVDVRVIYDYPWQWDHKLSFPAVTNE